MGRHADRPLRFGHWIAGACRFEGAVDEDGRSAEGPWVVARADAEDVERAVGAAGASGWPDLPLSERIAFGEAWVADLLENGAWVADIERRFGLESGAGDRWLELLDSLELEVGGAPPGAAERRRLERHRGPTLRWEADAGAPAPGEGAGPSLLLAHWSGLLLDPVTDALIELVEHGRPAVLAWPRELPELGEALGRSAAAVLPGGAFGLLQRPPLEVLKAALADGRFDGLGGRWPDRAERERLLEACPGPGVRPGFRRSLCGSGGVSVFVPEEFSGEEWGPELARSAFGRAESLSGQASVRPGPCLGVPEREFSAPTEALLAELEQMAEEAPPVAPHGREQLREFREVVIGALDEGATLIHGEVRGRRADWGPVVLTNVEERMSICAFEGAVPVLALMRVR